MKFNFDPNLDYQTDAVNAVINLFRGQISKLHEFEVIGQSFLTDSGYGVGNEIITDSNHKDILENLRAVQINNQLPPSDELPTLDFNIEMETGTGKTYVYLKTIFELYKEYGFTKFIIVVPSVAIKEGVNKTIEITREHFKELYDDPIYTHFIYDSSKLEQIRNFVFDSNIEIMIINIGAMNAKSKNIIYGENEYLDGYRPIDFIAETNPIVIIDEPQSVMGDKGAIAINDLKPLCTLRYSATHREIQNLIYKLDAVDAYQMNLVKKIEVASVRSENQHNKAYLKLVSVKNTESKVSAKIEIDVDIGGAIKRKTVTVLYSLFQTKQRGLLLQLLTN